MAVYLARWGDDGPVKIGTANDVRERIAGFQTASPVKINVLRLLVGGRSEEGTLHARFAHLRRRGEWFTFDPEMMGDVGLEEMALPSKEDAQIALTPDQWTTIKDVLDAIGGSAVIGPGMGVPTNTVTYWGLRGRVPAWHWRGLVELAQSRNIAGVDYQTLSRLLPARKPRKSRAEAA